MKNKVFIALASLVIAFGLWLYVITSVNPEWEETYYDIPVSLQNDSALQERGLMITTDETPTVTLKLKGNRADLLQLNESNITLAADLSRIYETGEQQLSYSIYPSNLPSNAFTVESQMPLRITLNVERRVTKEVPVSVMFEGEIAEGYMADSQHPVFDYETVSITGPSPVIEEITQAQLTVDLTGRTETIREALAFDLCNADGEKVDAHQVVANIGEINLTVVIQKMKEIPLTLTLVDGGGATQKTSRVKITPSSITVCGNETALDALTEINLGTVNLGELIQPMTEQPFTIKIPEGLQNLTNISEAKVSISFPNLRTQTFRVTNIQPVNVPEGMECELVTKELQITVRGPRELITAMKETDIAVTVDLASAGIGTSSVRATVTLGKNFAEAGTVGTYAVSVTLKKAEDAAAQGGG